MPSILIVDDEPDILETTRWAIETMGFIVFTAASAEDALPYIRNAQAEILLIDYKLPKMNGTELLKTAVALNPKTLGIMITGLTHESETIEEESRQVGAFAFLRKPLRMEEVLQAVKQAVQQMNDTQG